MKPQQSDRLLYESLVRSYSGAIYRFAVRLCGRHEVAEDLVQETFVEAWRSIRTLRDPTRGKAWLFQILRHRYAHALRDSSRRIQPTMDLGAAAAFAALPEPGVLDRLATRELLDRSLDALDIEFREPFLLVLLEGFSHREVAEMMGLPLGTVLSRVHRARLFLREYLQRLDPPEIEDSSRTNEHHLKTPPIDRLPQQGDTT